ncbi:MAG: hypothetical protein H7Y31_04780 [Chitinophagaceae bacterium]|nr:hypothetical protein [Chitinophagaceae bacterium]
MSKHGWLEGGGGEGPAGNDMQTDDYLTVANFSFPTSFHRRKDVFYSLPFNTRFVFLHYLVRPHQLYRM